MTVLVIPEVVIWDLTDTVENGRFLLTAAGMTEDRLKAITRDRLPLI